jgi:hypothetical protein
MDIAAEQIKHGKGSIPGCLQPGCLGILPLKNLLFVDGCNIRINMENMVPLAITPTK